MKAIGLRTEYLKEPTGIDIKNPRLMWNCEGGVKQTAYRIVTDNWDSGKVESSSMRAEYPKKLSSRERVTWRICLWDENGQEGEWSESFFETGLLDKSDWKAKWITGNYTASKKERYPVDCFRKAFTIDKPVASARLYTTACGLYEAALGGKKVGDFCFAPGYTDYRKRIQYQTYDVTGINAAGENRFVISPKPGGHFTHAEARYNSVYGEVKSGWSRDNGKTTYNITVPANCTAEIIIPDREPESVGPGTYTIGG